MSSSESLQSLEILDRLDSVRLLDVAAKYFGDFGDLGSFETQGVLAGGCPCATQRRRLTSHQTQTHHQQQQGNYLRDEFLYVSEDTQYLLPLDLGLVCFTLERLQLRCHPKQQRMLWACRSCFRGLPAFAVPRNHAQTAQAAEPPPWMTGQLVLEPPPTVGALPRAL